MSVDHTRKVGDDHRTWTQTLDDVDVDLQNATSPSVDDVKLYVEDPDGNSAVSGASCTIEDADTVSYQFAAGDLSAAGEHKAEFDVEFSDATVAVSPDQGQYTIDVVDDLI